MTGRPADFDPASTPAPVLELASRLADHGTPLTVVRMDDRLNLQVRAVTPRGTVQVTADRGQWFVDLAEPGSDEFVQRAALLTWLAPDPDQDLPRFTADLCRLCRPLIAGSDETT